MKGINMKRYSKLLRRDSTALLIIDIQERILGVMRNHEELINNAIKLIEGCKVLNIPIYVTEQYPKGLGKTASLLEPYLTEITPIEKSTFSCCGAEGLFDSFKNSEKKQIVISGIESHVCVQQTALDLIENGFSVTLAADAVSSRKEVDYNIALSRMRQKGIDISTTEAILFELLEFSGTEEFKRVSKLIK
jgi:nicotinamidase-related amidase